MSSSPESEDAAELIDSAFEEGRHRWVHVLVLPLTDKEAQHIVSGGRRSYRLDTTDPERLRSQQVMCAQCRFAPSTLTEMSSTRCPGESS